MPATEIILHKPYYWHHPSPPSQNTHPNSDITHTPHPWYHPNQWHHHLIQHPHQWHHNTHPTSDITTHTLPVTSQHTPHQWHHITHPTHDTTSNTPYHWHYHPLTTSPLQTTLPHTPSVTPTHTPLMTPPLSPTLLDIFPVASLVFSFHLVTTESL